MVASRKERDRLRLLTPVELQRFRAFVLLQRWADDLWLAYRLSVGQEFDAIITDITSPQFYGIDLLLLQTTSNVAFGNRIYTMGSHALEVCNGLPFIEDTPHSLTGKWSRRYTTLHGGPQWRSLRLTAGIIRGHLLRCQVGAGLSNLHKTSLLLRTAFELIETGSNEQVTIRQSLRVAREAFLDTRKVKRVLQFPSTRRSAWIGAFDAWERHNRLSETALCRVWALQNE